MQREGDTFYGALPKPKKTTKRIEYYVEAVDKALAESRTKEYGPAVVGPGECPKNMVVTSAKVAVGSLTPGAPLVPVGFSATGVEPVGAAGTAAGAAAGTTAGTAAAVATGGAAAGGLSGAAIAGIAVAVAGSGRWGGRCHAQQQ